MRPPERFGGSLIVLLVAFAGPAMETSGAATGPFGVDDGNVNARHVPLAST